MNKAPINLIALLVATIIGLAVTFMTLIVLSIAATAVPAITLLIMAVFPFVGALYSLFASLNKTRVEVIYGALGGALTSFLCIVTMVACASIVLAATFNSYLPGADRAAASYPLAQGPVFVTSLIAGACMMTIIAAGLGAVGGAIFSAVRNRAPGLKARPALTPETSEEPQDDRSSAPE